MCVYVTSLIESGIIIIIIELMFGKGNEKSYNNHETFQSESKFGKLFGHLKYDKSEMKKKEKKKL